MLNNLKLKLIEDSAGSLRDGAASSWGGGAIFGSIIFVKLFFA